jgi:hypothetical protein
LSGIFAVIASKKCLPVTWQRIYSNKQPMTFFPQSNDFDKANFQKSYSPFFYTPYDVLPSQNAAIRRVIAIPGIVSFCPGWKKFHCRKK